MVAWHQIRRIAIRTAKIRHMDISQEGEMHWEKPYILSDT
jgi:hypothetical protein